jgi:chaperone required for assembly of F1-ATPase
VTEATGNGSKRTGKGLAARPMPKRFYKAVTVAGSDATDAQRAGGFSILLDGKPMRTPAKAVLAVPTRALAEAIAAEWEAQGAHIDPATMPLTRLVNSGLDGVRGREAEVREDIAKYAASDLLCYRAPEPEALALAQARLWDPILAWSREALGVHLVVAEGIMPVAQPPDARPAVTRALSGYNALALTSLHVMTTLTGSALLTLAHARGRLGLEETWAAAHVDEDWQIARWGEDAQAAARRERRRLEMQSASRLLALLGVA